MNTSINKMSEKELSKLKHQINTAPTNGYKNNFWEKKYHNENILNPDRKKNYYEDIEFCIYWGIKACLT